MLRKTTMLCLALALAAPALAGTPVDQTLEADRHGKVSIEMGAGQLTIRGWDRGEVRIQGVVPDGEGMFEATRSGDTISIEVALPEMDCEDDDCDESMSWNVDIGSKDARHAEGDDVVKHKQIHKIKTKGKVRMNQEDTALEIDLPFGSSLDIEALSSRIEITDVKGEIGIESISGDVDIDGDFREISLEVVSGQVKVNNRGRIKEADIQAVSGSVELHTALADGADVSVETVNGGIEIWLPAGASCDITAETFSGDIDNDFGQKAARDSSMLPSKSLEFTLGDGDGEVSLQTFNGIIRIRKD